MKKRKRFKRKIEWGEHTLEVSILGFVFFYCMLFFISVTIDLVSPYKMYWSYNYIVPIIFGILYTVLIILDSMEVYYDEVK